MSDKTIEAILKREEAKKPKKAKAEPKTEAPKSS